MLNAPFKYLEHGHRVSGKFSGVKEKCKKLNFQEIQSQNGAGIPCQNTHFSLENFFQMDPENFLGNL